MGGNPAAYPVAPICQYPDCGHPSDHWHSFPPLYVTDQPIAYCRAHLVTALRAVYARTGLLGNGGPVETTRAVVDGIYVGAVRPPAWIRGALEAVWPLVLVTHVDDHTYEATHGETATMLALITGTPIPPTDTTP